MVCAPCSFRDEPSVAPVTFGIPGRSAQEKHDRLRSRERQQARRDLPRSLVVLVAVAISAYFLVQLAADLVNHLLRTHGAATAKPSFSPALAHEIGALVALVAGIGIAQQLWGRRRTTEAWAIGAKGERAVGARLAKVPGVLVLHDRRVPGSSANIDHIAIGPAGIFVIDAKTIGQGRRKVTVEQGGPVWDRGPAKLYVGGRDRPSFAEGLGWQVQAVQRALWGVPEAAGVPIHPMVVVVGGEWRAFSRPAMVGGAWVGTAREAATVVGQAGPLGTEVRQRLAEALSAGLPMA